MILVMIECNLCGTAGDTLWSHPDGGPTPTAAEVRSKAADAGWSTGKGGYDLCPNCRLTPSTDTYAGPGEAVWRAGPGERLHAVRPLYPGNPSSATVTCCDSSWIVTYSGEHLDYRYRDGATCRKGGCAAYFEASRDGRLG